MDELVKATAPLAVQHMFGPLSEVGASPFVYNAHMVPSALHAEGVVDGDTVAVDIDLGLRIWMRDVRVRLYGVSAPEVRGAERPRGLQSKAALVEMVRTRFPEGRLLLRTYQDKADKYGRWLGELWDPSGKVCLNRELVKAGYATWRVDW